VLCHNASQVTGDLTFQSRRTKEVFDGAALIFLDSGQSFSHNNLPEQELGGRADYS